MSNVSGGGLRYKYRRDRHTNELTDSGTSTNADCAEKDGGDDDDGVAACVRRRAKMLMPMMARAGCTDDTTKPGGQLPIYTNSRSSAPGGCYS